MNADTRTDAQKVWALEAEVLSLQNKLSDAEAAIEDLKAENEGLKADFTELSDYSDEEIRDEFLSRDMIDPMDREYRLLGEHIAAGETKEALWLLEEISNGAASMRVAVMLAEIRGQKALI